MSVQTWKAEFLPDKEYGDKPVEHCLRKWQGLTPGNLKKHELECLNPRCIEDVRYLTGESLNIEFCALCDDADDECRKCRYVQFHGQTCDERGKQWNSPVSPWLVWAVEKDPQPMIDALQQMKEAGYE